MKAEQTNRQFQGFWRSEPLPEAERRATEAERRESSRGYDARLSDGFRTLSSGYGGGR